MNSVAIIGTRGYPSYYGGFETAVRSLAPFLADRGWGVTVYGRPGAIRGDDPSRHRDVNSVITKGVERKSLSTLSFGLSATRDATRRRPSAALVMNVANGFWLPALRRARIPTVVNVDGMEWERAKWGRIGREVFRRGAAATARHADELVFDSLEIARRWQMLFARQGTYIPYGGEPAGDALPLEPGLKDRGYILAVARLVPENSVPEFLAAAEQLAHRTKVVLVGSSGYGGALEAHAAALAARDPNFLWLGHVSDDRRLHALWQHAGAYFHGHSVGGTNPALVQAMALGAPTVALDTPYNREVLGSAGRFVSADPAAIRDELASIVEEPFAQAQLSAAARQRAAEVFTWAKVNHAYEDLLLKAIQRGTRA